MRLSIFMVFSLAAACPQGTRAGTCGEEFWKELLGGKEKRSKEQNLKELGF
jgi:hypothetical protein